jgi:MFS family permease
MKSLRVTQGAPSKGWTLALAGLATFMTALDTLVVTTALPVLRAGLHAGLPALEWTVNAYNLAFACLLLTGAALGDRFGRRRMFTLGMAAFTAASAASALSPDVQALVLARAVQGAAAAIVTPLTLTLICEAFPAEKRGAAIGMWGGITGLAVAAGPVVGGGIPDPATGLPKTKDYHADPVLAPDGAEIGFSAGRVVSTVYRRMISLGFIKREYAAAGTEVTVVWGSPGTRQKRIRAIAARFPYLTEERNNKVDTGKIPRFTA